MDGAEGARSGVGARGAGGWAMSAGAGICWAEPGSSGGAPSEDSQKLAMV